MASEMKSQHCCYKAMEAHQPINDVANHLGTLVLGCLSGVAGVAAQTQSWCASGGLKKRCGQKFVHFNEDQGPQCLEQLGGQGLPCVTHGPPGALSAGSRY